jgi:hypothetical protein
LVGYVDAPDEQSAIKRAIEEYGITEPWKQARLVAHLWCSHAQRRA